jgi:hypothetical protein
MSGVMVRVGGVGRGGVGRGGRGGVGGGADMCRVGWVGWGKKRC